MKLYQILLIVLAAMSALSFCVYGMDKRRAARGQWRVSEKALLLLSFFFGATGGYLAMFVFRHKTRKWYFHLVNWISLAMQAALLAAAALFW